MGLTDVDKPKIDTNSADVAVALYDAFDLIKNSPSAYKQMVDEHKAMKATKIEHEMILDKNEEILNAHKTSRAAWADEQKRAKEADEKLDKEFADREKEIQRQQNAITAREDAVKRREKIANDLTVNLDQREAAVLKREQELSVREQSIQREKEQNDRDRNEIRATQDEMASVLARRKA